MKLSEYLLLSREERTKHIDLSLPCTLSRSRWFRERRELLNYLELEDDVPRWTGIVERCHLCDNGTTGGFCTRIEHHYLGFPSENHFDIPKDVRVSSASAAGKESVKKLPKEVLSRNGRNTKNLKPRPENLRPPSRETCSRNGRNSQNLSESQNHPNVVQNRIRQANRRFRCLVTDKVSNAGGLTTYQRSKGIDVSLREEIFE